MKKLNSYTLRCVLMLVIGCIVIKVISDPKLQAFFHPVKRHNIISQLTELPRKEPPKPELQPALKPELKPELKPGLNLAPKPAVQPGPNQPDTNKVKYLIYFCDKTQRCGGWADKQRGIVTAFVYSILLRRKFGLIMTSLCDIRQFYKPNVINWNISEDELKGKTRKTLYYMNRVDLTIEGDFNPYKHFDVLYLKTNSNAFAYLVSRNKKLMPSYINGYGSRGRPIFREVWNRLMKPTERIAKQVKAVIESKLPKIKQKSNLVCAHVRIGLSIYLPHDYRKTMDVNTTYKVLDFLDAFKTSKLFVATDHMDVRNSAIKQFGERYMGSYAHTMNADSTGVEPELACKSFEQALVDQAILSSCDVFIMSPSGFSYFAASLKLKQDNLFIFDGKTISLLNVR